MVKLYWSLSLTKFFSVHLKYRVGHCTSAVPAVELMITFPGGQVDTDSLLQGKVGASALLDYRLISWLQNTDRG